MLERTQNVIKCMIQRILRISLKTNAKLILDAVTHSLCCVNILLISLIEMQT